MTQIPNFPTVEDSWAPSYGANGGTIPTAKWVGLTPRTLYATSIKRGKQYELDQVQAGELQLTLNNPDGSLDPLNAAGPWGGAIRPYQPIQHRMQNSPTSNRFPIGIATGGEGYTAGTIPSSFGIASSTDSTGGSIVVLGAGVAYEESNAFQFAIPASSPAYATVMSVDPGAVAPGQAYTFSVYVRNITPGVNVTLTPGLGWYTAASQTSPSTWSSTFSTATLVGSASATWTRITVSGTAPANAYGALVNIALTSSGQAAACVVQADALQFEKASSATAWTYPGYWYGQFAGFVERWTPQFQDNGARAEVAITAVDAFALFSQRTLADAMTEEIKSYGPGYYYPLNDPQGSTTASDALGLQRSPSVIGTGTYAFGTAITGTDPVNGIFAGANTVLTVNNGDMLSLSAAGISGPAGAGSPGEWSRTIAFRWTGGTIGALTPCLWSAFDNQNSSGTPSGSAIQVQLSSTGVTFILTGRTGTSNVQVTGSFADGNWHQVVFGFSNSAGNQMVAVDGVYQTAAVGDQRIFGGLANDTIGGAYQNRGGIIYSANPWMGNLASVAEYGTMLNSAQVTSLYNTWKTAGLGESTDARYARILRYVGFTGTTWLDSGSTRSMGPCDFAGSDALSALQAVVDTETGSHWIQGSGTVRFRSRAGKYAQLTPTLIFGDGPGEIPYEDLQLDFDPTHLANVVQVTQSNTGQVFSAQDPTSIANYFTRLLTRTINSTSAAECQDAASYLLSRYKNAVMRVSAIKVNVSASNAWNSVLPLELGSRIRVMRRPLGCPPIKIDCFIEQLQWDYDTTGKAELTMQLSPADLVPSAMFAAWRTTQGAVGSAAGTLAFAVNPPLGDNSLALASCVYVGQQLTLEPGTAVSETLTVAAVSPTTAGSWTTGTITFSTPSAYFHAAGCVISEALPSPQTNPATWDSSAVFDSVNFAY